MGNYRDHPKTKGRDPTGCSRCELGSLAGMRCQPGATILRNAEISRKSVGVRLVCERWSRSMRTLFGLTLSWILFVPLLLSEVHQAQVEPRTITLPVVDGKGIRFTHLSTASGLSQT